MHTKGSPEGGPFALLTDNAPARRKLYLDTSPVLTYPKIR